MGKYFTRLEVFSDLMDCIGSVYLWHYDASMQLLKSNCPQESFWDNIFQTSACSRAAQEHCLHSRLPIMLSDPISLIWIAVPVWETDSLQDIHLLGPVFLSTFAEQQLEYFLDKRNVSISFKRELMVQLKQLPVVPHKTFMYFGIMLYFCLTETKIHMSDIQIDVTEPEVTCVTEAKGFSCDVHGGAEYEAMMLQLIEDGNLNYRDILSSAKFGRVGTLAPDNPLRQFKDAIITAVTLCSRAAIRGGLSRELALTLSDYYIQSIEAATTITEVGAVKSTMHEDFIRRVHQHRQLQYLSPSVKTCMDYIDSHITEKINIVDIAAQTGYSGYYISSLFKKEMKMGIGDYIKNKKVEYAKILLKNSNEDISVVADKLNFSSSSYFTSVFRQITGMTPKEFKEQQDE